MSQPRPIKIHLADGRWLVVTIEHDEVSLILEDVPILRISRADAWELAEAVEMLSISA